MVFLDTNILLELLLPNRSQSKTVGQFLSRIEEPTAVSVLSAHLVMYFGRRYGINDELLQRALERHQMLSMQLGDYNWAVQHQDGQDFEDALQVAVSLHHNCKQFITLDKRLAKRYAATKTVFVVPKV